MRCRSTGMEVNIYEIEEDLSSEKEANSDTASRDVGVPDLEMWRSC
jgi:hypothetical protein